MTSRAEPVKIGPFTGGLNTYSDPSTISDIECADINNFDIDLDGTLVSRPPVTMIMGPGTVDGFRILGYFVWTDNVVYILAATANNTYIYNTNTLAWTYMAGTSYSAMVQYANKAWLVSPPSSVNPGISWDPVAGVVVIASMPHGVTATIYKERMYIGSGAGHATPARLFFSLPANPGGTWSVSDFIDINNGDGQDIVEILNYNGAIVVFKETSTYMFAYESSPAKGATQILSSNIGVADRNCIAVFEGSMYVMYSGEVYLVSNWNWEQINVKVPFKYVNTHLGATRIDYYICVVGNRLICKYFDTYYVYGLKTKVWTKWTFSSDAQLFPGKFWKFPKVDNTTGIDTYYAGSALSVVTPSKSLQMIKDIYDNSSSESMDISVRSKTYNFNVPYSYKRLFWWGIDLLCNSELHTKLIPVSYGMPITWDQLSIYTWDQISSHAWDAPLDVSLDVSDSADIHNTSGIRMFVKLKKSIRFRQVAFHVNSSVDGTTATGPFRLFSITAFVANKQILVKKVS